MKAEDAAAVRWARQEDADDVGFEIGRRDEQRRAADERRRQRPLRPEAPHRTSARDARVDFGALGQKRLDRRAVAAEHGGVQGGVAGAGRVEPSRR